MGSSNFMNGEIKMYLSAVWIIMAWQCISPEVTVKGFKNSYISGTVQWMRLMIYCGMAVKRMGI
jgi:hypothetical protein